MNIKLHQSITKMDPCLHFVNLYPANCNSTVGPWMPVSQHSSAQTDFS